MLVEAKYEECRPLLLKLWPQDFHMIDNFHGRILFRGDQYSQMMVRFFAWKVEGKVVGVTECFTVGSGHLRLRGTYVEPAFRSQGIAQKLVLGALSHFSDCHTVFTFPREGSKHFYESLGFRIVSRPKVSADNLHPYGYAERRLIPHTL